jgi:hypothetical protein
MFQNIYKSFNKFIISHIPKEVKLIGMIISSNSCIPGLYSFFSRIDEVFLLISNGFNFNGYLNSKEGICLRERERERERETGCRTPFT